MTVREPTPEPANPLGMDGIEFIEYATSQPQALGSVLQSMGFVPVARHRSREVTLYRQGTMNLIVNAHPDALPGMSAPKAAPELKAIALRVRDAYARFDAEQRFEVPGLRIADPKACQCGEVLKGVLKPWECKVFCTACTPETPIGTCMVSPEGACAAYYNFGRFTRQRVQEATRV